MKLELFKDIPEGTVTVVSGGGFIDTELFVGRPKHSAEYAKPTEDDAVDNHMSHCRLEAATLCIERYVTLLSLTPHSSHKLQLLDRGSFVSIKTVQAAWTDKWIHQIPGLRIPQGGI